MALNEHQKLGTSQERPAPLRPSPTTPRSPASVSGVANCARPMVLSMVFQASNIWPLRFLSLYYLRMYLFHYIIFLQRK